MAPPAAPLHHDPETYLENGREYHQFWQGIYMYPCDETEKDRLDILHQFFLIARNHALHSVPLAQDGSRKMILDVGCGTGIWCIEMAERYRDADVQGWDLTKMQPPKIPPNLTFRQKNFELPGSWMTAGTNVWDMVHMQTLAGSVESWPDLYRSAFNALKPHVGHLEHVEIDLQPRCDDNSLPSRSALNRWWSSVSTATAQANKPLSVLDNAQVARLLTASGFIDVHTEIIRVPFTPWIDDTHAKEMARWFCLCLNQGIQAYSMAPLTRISRWRPAEVDALCADAIRDVNCRSHHVYALMYIHTARKP